MFLEQLHAVPFETTDPPSGKWLHPPAHTGLALHEDTAMAKMGLLEALANIKSAREAGERAATLVSEHRVIDAKSMELLKADTSINEATKDLLAELDDAHGKVFADPYARLAWLRRIAADMEVDGVFDPEKLLKLIFACMKVKDAIPVLKVVPRNEARQWPVKMFIPSAQKGAPITQSGVNMVVPNTPEDEETLRAIIRMRKKATETLLVDIGLERLADPRRFVWLALYMFENASIWPESRLQSDYEDGEPGLLRRKRDSKMFAYWCLSSSEVLLLEKSVPAETMVAHLERMVKYQEEFWNGTIDFSHADALEMLAPEECISPKDFLAGLPGLVAVQHHAWKTRKNASDTTEVLVVFMRLVGDPRWRWLAANHAAAVHLFSGKKLAHHSWSRGEIPGHLQALLRTGEVIEPE